MTQKDEEYWNLLQRVSVKVRHWAVRWSRRAYYRLVKPSLGWVLGSIFWLGIIAIGFTVGYWGDDRVLTNDDGGLFATVGAMVAGMLAIVFALRVLLIQNAAATQSSGLFDIMASDRWQNPIYWMLAIISLFDIGVAAVLLGSPNMLSCMPAGAAMGLLIATTGISLFLVFYQLSRTYKRINPLNSINHVKGHLIRQLSKIGNTARLDADYIRARELEGQPQSDSKRLAVSFLVARPQFSKLFSDCRFLFDYHDKLYQQRENTAARLVLWAIGEIAVKYMDIRQDSFMLVPSSEPFVMESDSQRFFSRLLEQLGARAENYMKAGDDEGVTAIINILEIMITKAVDVSYIGEVRGENPLVWQCHFHLGLIIDYAGLHKHREGLLQGVKSLGKISQLTARANLHLEAQAISEQLYKAAIAGLRMRQDIVWTEAITSHCMLLAAYGCSRSGQNAASLSFIFDFIRFTLRAAFIDTEATHGGWSGRVYTSFRSPFETASKVIYNLTEHVKSGDQENSISPTDVIDVCEDYLKFLRKLSGDVKSADSYMVEAAAKSIHQISILLLQVQTSDEFRASREEVQRTLSWLVNQLGWFAESAEEIKDEHYRDNHYYDSLVESAAKIGLQAVKEDNSDIASTAIKVINRLAEVFADKTHTSYYESVIPRIMGRACVVGILALKRKQVEPMTLLQELVAEFDVKAREQVEESIKASTDVMRFPVRTLEEEVGSLYETCMREKYDRYPLDNNSERMLFAEIECKDIDDFCEEIWGFKASERYKSTRIF